MSFRIREIDGDTVEHEAAEALYRKHLTQFRKTSNRDLWKFFYWDFFHDGAISQVRLSPDLLTLELDVSGPNMKRWADGTFTYICASFKVRFRGVRLLHIETEPDSCADATSAWDDQALSFRYGEINSHPSASQPQLGRSVDDLPYSLVVEFAGDRPTWLEVVFEQVDVEPEEPLAFALMESDPQFSMPTYNPAEQDVEADV